MVVSFMEGILNDEPYYEWNVLLKYFQLFLPSFLLTYLHIVSVPSLIRKKKVFGKIDYFSTSDS